MIDIESTTLSNQDKLLLKHDAVAGVILFGRNYENPEQLMDLISSIRAESSTRLLITVDHEGGRVQRFKSGFTELPPAQAYAELKSIDEAKMLAFDAGWVLAMELLAFDIDLSFSPVLDLGHDCLAIGSRSFHQDKKIAYHVASSMIDGMHQAGMKTTGKHFPGHGAVIADSHKETPIDSRKKTDIEQDMWIFSELIKQNKLDAIMPAHVIYPAFDSYPACGSSFWLKDILRTELQFTGVVFSDDLSMEGAAFLGDYQSRAKAALNAGCDILLACNNREGTLQILESLNDINNASNPASSLLASRQLDYDTLRNDKTWQVRHQKLTELNSLWKNKIKRA